MLGIYLSSTELGNIPPIHNSASVFAENDIKIIAIGFNNGGYKNITRVRKNYWIFRIAPKSAIFSIPILRGLFKLIFLILVSRSITRRKRATFFSVFNDPANICIPVLRSAKVTTISWMLEFPEYMKVSLAERLLLKISNGLSKHSDMLVAPSRERLAMQMTHYGDVKPNRCFVVHNAPCLRDAPGQDGLPAERHEELTELLRRNKFIIGYSGAIGSLYGLDRLARAILASDHFGLVMVGKKHPRAAAQIFTEYREAEVSQRILWIDEIPYEKLPGILRQCHFGFCHYDPVSLNTKFAAPGKAYEYLSHGLPVLMPENSLLSDFISESSIGIEYASITNEFFKSLERRLLAEPDLAASMRRNAIALHSRRLNMQEQMKPLVEALRIHAKRAL